MFKNHAHKKLLLILFLCTFPTPGYSDTSSEFPGRKIYSFIDYIEISEFYRTFEIFTVVDVRSTFEYDTLRISGAINIPLASKDFTQEIRKLREQTHKPIVVYCNGKTCMKSYKAVLKCKNANIDNIIAYDGGIMDWAKAHPKLTILLGKALDNPDRLLSNQFYQKHSISPGQFGILISDNKGIALDIRDGFQREGIAIFSGVEKRVSLDNKQRLDKYIAVAKKKNLPLLIFDAAGKQTRWLQYYLEEKQLKNYYFMAGGVRAYYESLMSFRD